MRYIALDMRVLVVAIEGKVKDWSAYIGAVKGDDHEMEAEQVAWRGSKIPYWMAKRLFPDFDARLRWRD